MTAQHAIAQHPLLSLRLQGLRDFTPLSCATGSNLDMPLAQHMALYCFTCRGNKHGFGRAASAYLGAGSCCDLHAATLLYFVMLYAICT